MTINELSELAHSNAKEKGFYEGVEKNAATLGQRLMLTVGELGEAQEAHRKGRIVGICPENLTPEEFKTQIKDTLFDEIADAYIRLGDLCGWLGVDIESFIRMKMAFNSTREIRHGKKY